MLELYESNFGPVQAQKVPADGSIRVEDGSQELDARTSSIYRSLIGMLYLSQERMDVGFVKKELASKMSKPTAVALARLKKLLGYLKATADYACKLASPAPGLGLVVHSNHELNLGSFSDRDWSGSKVHRRSGFVSSSRVEWERALPNFADATCHFALKCRSRATFTGFRCS